MPRTEVNTKSCKPELTALQTAIRELVEYLKGNQLHGESPSGLLNWLRIKPEEKEGWFNEKFLIDRKQFSEKLQDVLDSGTKLGRAHDYMVLSVGNDLVAQIEMAGNFRRLKPAHHFAKARYNLRNLAEGAEEPKQSDSILEEYTTVFLQNAVAYISEHN
jgi:hypothetical protein